MILSARGEVVPPSITIQPQSQTVVQGGATSFSVTAAGDNLAYQWWLNGATIPDGTNPSCTITNVQPINAGDYHVVVSNEAGSTNSAIVTLTVNTPPAIAQIGDQTVDENRMAGPLSFTIGDAETSVQSLKLSASSSNTNLVPDKNIVLGGSNNDRTLTIAPATNQFGTCTIKLTVADADGATASTTLALTVNHVNQPPQFVGEPPWIVPANQPYSYTVTATDPDAGDQVTVGPIVLPAWMSYDPVTRVLSGTPPPNDTVGYGCSLYVRDLAGATTVKDFRIWTKDVIGIHSVADLELKRQAVINYVWGADGWPTSRNVTKVSTGFSNRCYDLIRNQAGNLSRIDVYTIGMDYGMDASVYHFIPLRSNGRLFLYHGGHNWGGFQSDDVSVNNNNSEPGLVIPKLLKEGYSVLAFNMPIYHSGPLPTVSTSPGSLITISSHVDMFTYLERPYRFFLEPIAVALNYVQDQYGYKNIYMTGLSGGGWTTTIYSALDTRIERSFPVAGSVPMYLRSGAVEAEETDPGFYQTALYEDFYVMGAYGERRAQLQINNRYDPCCFYGTNYVYWVDDVKSTVQQLGAGTYDFLSDDTHSEHKISTSALSAILDSLPPTFNPISDLNLVSNSGPQSVPISGIAPALLSRTNILRFSVVTDNPSLFESLGIEYANPAANASCNFATASNALGTATITITLSDGQSVGSSYTRHFKVNILPPSSLPDVQWLGPTNGTSLPAPQPVTLQAAAADSTAGITRVEFWDGVNLLGAVTEPPFDLVWSNVTVGTHQLRAVAMNGLGLSSTTGPIGLTVLPVDQPPFVQWLSPSNDMLLQMPQQVTLQAAATDPDGAIVEVEFWDGTNSLGVITTPPYALLWSNATVGTHALRAVATDDRGATTAADTILLTVLPLNQAPSVQWLSPTNESILQRPQPMTLQATASDLDGTVARVEFRDGTNSLGVVSNPPYSLLWSNPTVGTHTLSAVATDDRGTASSELITVTVSVTPTNEAPLTIQSVQFVAIQEPPVTKSALDPANSEFQLQIAGRDGSIVVVEASTDLSNWVPISTNTLVNGVVVSADADSRKFNIRFYRARQATQTP